MTKAKTPCFSLDAKGSLAQTLTFTRRRGVKIVESKPTLPFFESLPVVFQRLLYGYYLDWWSLMSAADKQTWKSLGSRYHMPGLAYYLRDRLTNLPDILLLYHSLAPTSPLVHDWSRQDNHGTIIGATWHRLPSGLWYLSYDGINDQVVSGDLGIGGLSELTMKCWYNFTLTTGTAFQNVLMMGGKPLAGTFGFGLQAYRDRLRAIMADPTHPTNYTSKYQTTRTNDGLWHYVGVSLQSSVVDIFWDASYVQMAAYATTHSAINAFELGSVPLAAYYLKGSIAFAIVSNLYWPPEFRALNRAREATLFP